MGEALHKSAIVADDKSQLPEAARNTSLFDCRTFLHHGAPTNYAVKTSKDKRRSLDLTRRGRKEETQASNQTTTNIIRTFH